MTQPPVETLLLKQPTLSAEQLAFLYAGDLWIADLAERDGLHALRPRRLTAQKGQKLNPIFSPDGRWIAFSGNYDGNLSVYVVSREGGSPRRLTYHPGADLARGWTPDGERVLFASARQSSSFRYRKLFTIPAGGGFPTPLPMPMAERGSFSPDGKRLAYTPYYEAFWSWKRYRGGMTLPIWVLDMETYDHVEIPHENASDTFPCWAGGSIYFLSDRCSVMNVFRYAPEQGSVEQVTFHNDFDVRSLAAGHGRLAYEQAGRVHLLDMADGAARPLAIRISADLPETRPHFIPAAPYIQNAGISPTGLRAVFEARGDILTVPAKKGSIRNLTQTTGAAERDPAWSPDGKAIAYFSDAGGEYELVIADQKGVEKTNIPLGEPLGKTSFFYSPTWSPDSQKIVFTDKSLHLYYIVLETKEIVHVDTDTYDHPERSLNPAWSPDSRWLAYTKRLENHIRAVFLYELESRQATQVTDGMSDATSACFSKDGKYLFFTASSNYGLNTGWLDMSSFERPVSRSLYVVVLSKDDPSPLAPESDEEQGPEKNESEEKDASGEASSQAEPANASAAGETGTTGEAPTSETPEGKAESAREPAEAGKPAGEEKKPAVPVVKIDLEKIEQRILALPMPPRAYRRLQAAEGRLFFLEQAPNQPLGTEFYTWLLNSYDLKERKTEVFVDRVRGYWVSADGKKLLFATGNSHPRYAIIGTEKKPEPRDIEYLKLDDMEINVDPPAEWRQIFREAYRIHRDFFYDAAMHGLDWDAACAKYLPFLDHVGHRDDLNYLLAELSGELVVGHAYVGFGDIPSPPFVSVGLLGADYEVVDGFYRIRRIYPGLNWHPELRSPLTEPGVNVSEGEYLLAVNGRPLRYPTNLYSLFEKTADQIIDLRVGPNPNEEGARIVTVRPVGDETPLRHWNWVEENRRKVDALSNGRVAYVYMADTSVQGYESFNRYYFSQLKKEAVVLDERFNGGGMVADYIIDLLHRPVLSHWATREGKEFTTPNASIFGPKVMIINEHAGSGGDALPHFFRRRGLGKLVGKRTWGGLIGIYDYPVLIDGGFFSSPRMAIFSPDGQWEVENEGVAPDVEVEMTPRLAIAGHDPQLEKAVEVVLAELEARPTMQAPRPAPAGRAKSQ
jgi:tricorn protease